MQGSNLGRKPLSTRLGFKWRRYSCSSLGYRLLDEHYRELEASVALQNCPRCGEGTWTSLTIIFFIYSYVHTMFGSFLPPFPSLSLYPRPLLLPSYPLASRQKLFYIYL
jgi:hypothetical protein